MRIGYASPWPPARSGIADYSAELVPALARRGAELTLLHAPAGAPDDGLRESFPVRPIDRVDETPLDAVVYQIGNSAPHHEAIYLQALRRPGVVALHEYMLHHLVLEVTLGRHRGEAYVEEMRYAAGESGRTVARRLLDTHHPVDLWRFPLFERVVDRSFGALVHSHACRRRILASRPAARVRVVPFPVDLTSLPPADPGSRRQARAELDLPADAFVLASYGLVTPHKRLEPALAAFARLRERRPDALFLVCGEVSPHYDLDGALDRHGRGGVRLAGRLELAAFHRAMTAADVAVNLRHPSGGETSASLLRLLALGVPTLVSDAGSFAEIPDGVVAKVPVGEGETALLVELFRALAGSPALRRGMGEAARRHVVREHDVDRAARIWLEAVSELATPNGEPLPVAPPLSAPARGPRLELLESVGADLADLGLDEREPELLAGLAAEIAGLGWAPRTDGSA